MSMVGDLASTPDPEPEVPPSPPPSSPASSSGWRRYRHFILPVVGLVAAGGISAAAALLLLKPATTIDRMVPATVGVYALANLDPSATQKMNILRAVHRFPDTSTDQKIRQKLDEALKDSGVSFSGDIRPWLGSQLGVAMKLPSSSVDAPSALLAASQDDKKAQAFLAKLRAGKFRLATGQKASFRDAGQPVTSPQNYSWQDRTYDGVTIAVGTPKGDATQAVTYAMVDHVVVLTNNEALIREIIDTERGRAARLVDSADYRATIAKLPADRLAVGYVNGQSLVSRLKGDLTRMARPFNFESLNTAGDMDALRGMGMALTATSDGVVAELAISFDKSKLTPTTAEALTHPGHPETVVGWIPATSSGFVALTNIHRTISSLLDQTGNRSSIRQATDQVGLTGRDGVLPHLTGEFGVEVRVDSSRNVAGAILLGTDDAASLRRFFDGLTLLVAGTQSGRSGAGGQTGGGGQSSPGSPDGQRGAVGQSGRDGQLSPTTTTYQGVVITTLALPQAGVPFAPSYAVVDGMGILASTPAELRAMIDAHRTHHGIAADARYAAASHDSFARPGAIGYVNVGYLVSSLMAAAGGGSGRFMLTRDVANLQPIEAFMLTSTSSSDGFRERFVILVR